MKLVKVYPHNLGFRYTKYTHERPCIWDSTPIKYPILIYVRLADNWVYIVYPCKGNTVEVF